MSAICDGVLIAAVVLLLAIGWRHGRHMYRLGVLHTERLHLPLVVTVTRWRRGDAEPRDVHAVLEQLERARKAVRE